MAQTELLYGVHPVAEALAAGRRKIYEVFLARGRSEAAVRQILETAGDRRIPVRVMDTAFWASKEPGHQSVAAAVGPYPLVSEEDILARAGKRGEDPFVLVLDQVEDPQNCGALLRSALCAGVHGVVLPDRHAAPLGPTVSKASAGAMEHVLAARVPNLARSLRALKQAGLWIYGADASAGVAFWDADLSGPAALCVGSEGRGLRRLVRDSCDLLVSIPQQGPVGSLNASVAGALILFEALRQRRGKDRP